MRSLALLLGGVAAGLVVGLVFFGGLWSTARRLPTSSRPGLLIALSLLGRLTVLTVVMVVLARIDVTLLVGSLVGVVATRLALVRAATTGRLSSPAVADEPSGEGA